MAFFQNFDQSTENSIAILVIDASFSTTEKYGNGMGSTRIFDQMETIAKNLPHQKFRLVFWTSDGPKFANGVIVFPFVVPKTSLSQPFRLVFDKISTCCLTCPHLGFDAIPETWWNKTESNHVYFITDGQIGWASCPPRELEDLKQKFAASIQRLYANVNNFYLKIIAIEKKTRDFNHAEAMNGAAGCDVYEVIRGKGLTDIVSGLITYNQNYPNGYSHMSTTRAPPGFIPFDKKIFTEAKTGEFITWIYTQIQEKRTNEDDLLRILQSLTESVRVLTKDKSKNISVEIIQNFSELFRDSLIEPMMVNFMLTNAIDLANQGKIEVYAKHRANLKDIYKMANDLLNRSAKNAIGIRRSFVSLPVHGKIITGPGQMVTETMDLGGNRLPSSAVKIDNLNIPVLPLDIESSDTIEQCLRQFIRMIIGSQYGVDKLGDVVIYIVLGLMMLVVNSSASSEIKNAYRYLSSVMLRKKRMNTNITELERIESGEFPTPNSGKIEHFYAFMTTVNGILGTTTEPMVLWYAIVQSLGNSMLILKQLPHCQDAVLASYGEIPENIGTLLLDGITRPDVVTVSQNSRLDYSSCLITLNNCEATGGYRLPSHLSPTGHNCHPIYVFSDEGHRLFLANHDQFCPVCYGDVSTVDFEPVPPRITGGDQIFTDELVSVYGSGAVARGGYAGSSSQTSSFAPPTREPAQVATSSLSKQNKHLFKMEGDVGAGKTTTANAFEQTLNSLGLNITVFNVSTDMHCKKGVNPKGAVNNVKAQLKKLSSVTTEYVVVIIDTCNDKGSGKVVFDFDFSGWTIHTVRPNFDKDNIGGYLRWSLRNVLNRGMHNSTTLFYLNPVAASTEVCLKVHTEKGQNLFGRNFEKVYYHVSKDQILEEIQVGANAYQAYLDKEHVLDVKITELVNKVLDA